jgi:Pyruvate/2-oxoacid:ferredoxin oxidoreductase delta subunit
VQVNEPLSLERHVASHEDAVAILESKDLIVVTECICRKEKNMLGKGCHRPVENCFMFGSMARYYLDNNMGRQVDLEEAKTIIARSQEAGLVTQPSTSLNPSGMCNCCGDCCGVLLSLKRQDEPASLVFSNHFARVDAGSCTACENCIDYCPMEALSISDEGIAEVDLRRCIGCGVCVIQCNEDALYLQRKDESAVRVPPENEAARMMTLAKKRGIL